MDAEDRRPIVVLAEEQTLPLEQRHEQYFGIVDPRLERTDLLDDAFITSELLGDFFGPILVVPEIGGRGELSQLDQLGLFAGEVKGTSGRRRDGSGVLGAGPWGRFRSWPWDGSRGLKK
jgi:hypothetical protein